MPDERDAVSLSRRVSPADSFRAGAGAALAPVAKEIEVVKGHARSGGLVLDENAARQLLADLSGIQSHVHRLIADSAAGLDVRLRLGDNFVGRTVGERLRGVATSSAIPVLEEFSRVLEDLELTVRTAAGLYVAADEQAQEDVLHAAERLEQVVERGEGGL